MVRTLLIVFGLINIGFGAWMMFDPYGVINWILQQQGSDLYEGTFQPASLGEFRAISGLITMLGALTLRALWNPVYASWLQPLAWCFLGVSMARLSSLLIDGPFSIYTFVAGLTEATFAFLLGVHSQRLQRELDQEEIDDEEYDEEEFEEETA